MGVLRQWSVMVVAGCAVLMAPASASAAVEAGCELDPFRERIDATVGSMRIERVQETTARDVRGRPVASVDLGLTGEVDGCVTLDGPIPDLSEDPYSWLYDVPDVSLPQEHLLTVDAAQPYPLPVGPGDGNTSPRHYARGTFEASDGAGMHVFFPRERKRWNGKLFLFQHGSGVYTQMDACYSGPCEGNPPGTLVPRERGSLVTPGLGRNLFIEQAIDRGYAAVWMRRDAVRPPLGVSKVRLEDGTVLRTTHVAHTQSLLAYAEFAQRYVARRLGREPSRTYYFGHSGGGITGRLVNYSGGNVAGDNTPIIDGLLLSDPGNGLYLPLAFEGGRDTLFEDPAVRDAFVPQMEITHTLYRPLSYLAAKRATSQILRDKGLGDRFRAYEVLGLSHFDAGMAGVPGTEDAIDLGPMVSALTRRLDEWVRRGAEPPSSKEALPGSDPPVAHPEVACPLGVLYAPGGGPRSELAAFDGEGPEPTVPVTGELIDMNANGVADRRETVTEAWRRLNLIAPDAVVSPDVHRLCVARAALKLFRQGLLPARAVAWYVAKADDDLARSGARLE